MSIKKNNNDLWKLLESYLSIEGMSRYEDEVAKALRENTKDAGFEYSRDGMGSLIMNKKGNANGPKIMVAAHMDEVGFIVLDIQKNGQIKLSMVGGVWPHTVVGQSARLINSEGKVYRGIFGHTSIHILEREKVTKTMKLNEMFVDCGFKSKEEAIEAGVEPGDRVYMEANNFTMGKDNEYVVGKAMDNRAGVTIIDQVVNNLKDVKNNNDLYVVGTVQEEVGTRGARTSVSKINPDIAIAIDTCASHDTFGAIAGVQELGKGIALRVKDGGTMMDPKLVKFIYSLAKKHNIPCYKFVAQGGGTDAAQMQYGKGGVATITLSIPQRYLHSPHGVCHLTDIKAGIQLITEFVKVYDADAWKEMQYK
ncbi:M42 family metallopeptidase [Mycoplasma marinum]|uniref:Aminopeptidase n=1 Tax=Mycoplasma marinum TaxID=1937190 RepID=A0A4V2NI27_9MOLU|nr:M42 family metallopeptidase [Mycoplasma marinum]TCG10818.1 aminopeptidase [Mycoplasma marinum]